MTLRDLTRLFDETVIEQWIKIFFLFLQQHELSLFTLICGQCLAGSFLFLNWYKWEYVVILKPDNVRITNCEVFSVHFQPDA